MVEKSTVSYGGLLGSSTPGPDELSKGLSPHAYGQTFVDAHISFSKGCFTGQELVGRLDARGANVPFVVARYEGSDPEYADAQLKKCGPEGPQGLTSVSHSEGRWRGLAIAHRTFVSSGGFEITPLS
jgi:folate-binding Fe-S cluster repair protein YgfZ